MNTQKEPFENNVRKDENPGYQYFLLFPLCLLYYERQISPFDRELLYRPQTL